MRDFFIWFTKDNPAFYEWFINIGHSKDWSDPSVEDKEFNGSQYKDKGIRSKYIANMRSDKAKPKKPKKSKKK